MSEFVEPATPTGFPLELMGESEEAEKLWKLLGKGVANDIPSIQHAFVNHCVFSLARTKYNLDNFGAYGATALTVRDRLIDSWNPTQQHFTSTQCKRVYYLSLEFLMGRSMQNALLNLEISGPYQEALKQLGFTLEDLYEEEKDAALGNGGLGRLAACFMDSMATLDLPAWGYGIRYKYGMFAQKIVNGAQVEFPDYWLTFGSPWEVPRLDVCYRVPFYGSCEDKYDPVKNESTRVWKAGENVQAVAYDVPIPGFRTHNTINIRLWGSKPDKEFDLASFNSGNYYAAIDEKRRSEDISSVLYPNDNTTMGKELRLKQQFFFVSATVQDILRRFKKMGRPLTDLPEQVAIQLNDTHPSIGIAELLRILVDIEGLSWADAWGVVTKVYSFTNHTILPEALEKWSVPLMTNLLPRHMEIIYHINHLFLEDVRKWRPGDDELVRRMSIIEEGNPKTVRMAHLAIIGSHTVNGVAALHSSLLKTTLFKDFVAFYGAQKFQNKTNGVTPRRWLNQANPELAELCTQWLESDEWLKDLSLLSGLRPHVNNPELVRAWAAVKKAKKVQLAELVMQTNGVRLDTDALFDIQVKRIHEYKRQLMNILQVIFRYQKIKNMPHADRESVQKRVVLFGGKAAPGYHMAKNIIKLITHVGEVVNKDADIGDLLKVVFIPNYNVSNAEVIIPASDISEHISTAGMEASGTSNMKFALNGGLIIGTMDGANIEIAEQIGEQNMFIFGALTKEVDGLRHDVRHKPQPLDPRLQSVINCIKQGTFGHDEAFNQIIDSITHGNDYYLVTIDFPSYLDLQEHIDTVYADAKKWTQMSIMSTAGMGFFSSDRTIQQYADEIWNIKAQPRAAPAPGRSAAASPAVTTSALTAAAVVAPADDGDKKKKKNKKR